MTFFQFLIIILAAAYATIKIISLQNQNFSLIQFKKKTMDQFKVLDDAFSNLKGAVAELLTTPKPLPSDLTDSQVQQKADDANALAAQIKDYLTPPVPPVDTTTVEAPPAPTSASDATTVAAV